MKDIINSMKVTTLIMVALVCLASCGDNGNEEVLSPIVEENEQLNNIKISGQWKSDYTWGCVLMVLKEDGKGRWEEYDTDLDLLSENEVSYKKDDSGYVISIHGDSLSSFRITELTDKSLTFVDELGQTTVFARVEQELFTNKPASISINNKKLVCKYAFLRRDTIGITSTELINSLHFYSFDILDNIKKNVSIEGLPYSWIKIFFNTPISDELPEGEYKACVQVVQTRDLSSYDYDIYSNGLYCETEETVVAILKSNDKYSVTFNNLPLSGSGIAKVSATFIFDKSIHRFTDSEIAAIEKSEYASFIASGEILPEFPGGTNNLLKWLSMNVKYPEIAEKNGIQGRVICSFVVERDGTVGDVHVNQSVDPLLDKESMRVVSSMPSWIPGSQFGGFVRVKYTVPITYRLQLPRKSVKIENIVAEKETE